MNEVSHEQSGVRGNAVEHLGRIKEKIMKTWELRVRESDQMADEQTTPVLRNMLPELIDNLAKNLSSNSLDVDFQKAGAIGTAHGGQRAGLTKYTFSHILYEYRILRQVIFETLEQEKLHEPGIRNIILNVMDEGIQKAVEQFSIVRSRELEQSNRDLEHFAAIAAHDLKSPLATISGYMEVLDDNLSQIISAEDARFIKTVKRSAAQMTVLIDRLLEYSGIGRQIGVFKRVSSHEIVKEVMQSLESKIKASCAKIMFEGLPEVVGEASLLSQLFQNLISNSIKFRNEDRAPEIRIQAREESTRWIFAVSDNGIGFDLADRDNIFTLFKKVHSRQSHSGYGIGLATVRKIVELHGGSVWAESESGKGSTFFFTIAK